MQLTLALLALVASVAAQTATIETASGKLPSNCTNNFSGTFEISPQNQTDFSGSQVSMIRSQPSTLLLILGE